MYLIIFDLDDTLLNDDKEVSDFTLKTLKEVRKLGHLIVINTSRSKQHSQSIADLIKPDYGIYSGGAQIVDKDGKTIYETPLSRKNTKEITSYLVKVVENLSIQTGEHFYTNSPTYRGQNAIYVNLDDGLDEESYKIIVKHDNIEELKVVADKYDLAFQNYLNGPFSRFGSKKASKEEGNRALKKLLGNKDIKTIVFGDDVGDEKMILDADEGVVVSNGNKELLKKAKHVTASNNEDGVALFLKNFFAL